MRKQYHFQPSKKGYYAWDVDRLVQLSKNLPVKEIPLAQIKELDELFWYQNESTKPTCRSLSEHVKLVNAAELQYPIILSSKGRVMDGMHRVVKALALGNKTIKAVQFAIDPKPDYEDVQEEELPYD